ncbi:hypothetical protein BDQ17DRAFT_1334021 [Cyathus striatus]|nr:hypothetical protein BDQ17DRAFT_1334021 [Cyathus striatus]
MSRTSTSLRKPIFKMCTINYTRKRNPPPNLTTRIHNQHPRNSNRPNRGSIASIPFGIPFYYASYLLLWVISAILPAFGAMVGAIGSHILLHAGGMGESDITVRNATNAGFFGGVVVVLGLAVIAGMHLAYIIQIVDVDVAVVGTRRKLHAAIAVNPFELNTAVQSASCRPQKTVIVNPQQMNCGTSLILSERVNRKHYQIYRRFNQGGHLLFLESSETYRHHPDRRRAIFIRCKKIFINVGQKGLKLWSRAMVELGVSKSEIVDCCACCLLSANLGQSNLRFAWYRSRVVK